MKINELMTVSLRLEYKNYEVTCKKSRNEGDLWL